MLFWNKKDEGKVDYLNLSVKREGQQKGALKVAGTVTLAEERTGLIKQQLGERE